ncbi:unnamed protein product [Lupinus luteus]|uniref:Uncharacterized protein n=1 Tax=Lupinus luteus TaxID=3873 RepID=A0AAV1W1Z7_LUPLU
MKINLLRFLRVHDRGDSADRDGSKKDTTIGEFNRKRHCSENIDGFDNDFVEGIRNYGRVDTSSEEDATTVKYNTINHSNSGGSVADSNILRFRNIDKHLRGGLWELNVVEDGGAVVCDDNIARRGGDHLVHSLGVEAGANNISDEFRGGDVNMLDILLALVANGESVCGVEVLLVLLETQVHYNRECSNFQGVVATSCWIGIWVSVARRHDNVAV